MKKTVLIFVLLLLGLVVVLFVRMQVAQVAGDGVFGTNVLHGVVLDQAGQPLPDVELSFRNTRRRYLIYPPLLLNTPSWEKVRILKTKTDQRGEFRISFRAEFLEFTGASKSGYQQDGSQLENSWRILSPGVTHHTTFRIVATSSMRPDQIHKLCFDALPFPQDGQLSLNLREGKISQMKDSDLLFRWRKLPASANHGEYGKFVIRAPSGGIWLWEQESLFAPIDGYEDGIEFFFGPRTMGAYMKLHRAELFLRSRNGQLHARVFVQLDTARSTLSLRARVNTSSNSFVDANAENYAIGVYGSLSPDYISADSPWWIKIEPNQGQILVSEERLRSLLSKDSGLMFHIYFAEHYQTPADVLANFLGSDAVNNHFVPQAIASNLGAPLNMLQQLATNTWTQQGLNTNPWWMVGKNAQATLALPEDVRRFLAEKE